MPPTRRVGIPRVQQLGPVFDAGGCYFRPREHWGEYKLLVLHGTKRNLVLRACGCRGSKVLMVIPHVITNFRGLPYPDRSMVDFDCPRGTCKANLFDILSGAESFTTSSRWFWSHTDHQIVIRMQRLSRLYRGARRYRKLRNCFMTKIAEEPALYTLILAYLF